MRYNPEKRSWRGRSYRKGGQRIRRLREAMKERSRRREQS